MNRKNLVLNARRSIERGSKSFSRASKLFSRQTRERAWLLYSWCRACDDLADGQDHGEGMAPVKNPEKTIAVMRMKTRRAHGGEQTGNPPFDAFGIVAQECHIPLSLANDMIDGFALDARGWRPEDDHDLLQYCYHVAGSVGCMMAIVMGVSARDQDVLDRACDLGLAFQLANIARGKDTNWQRLRGKALKPRSGADFDWRKIAKLNAIQEKVRREGQHFGQDLAELARLVRNARVHLQENAALQELFGVDTGSDDAIVMDCKVAHHFAAALPSLFVCLIEWRS